MFFLSRLGITVEVVSYRLRPTKLLGFKSKGRGSTPAFTDEVMSWHTSEQNLLTFIMTTLEDDLPGHLIIVCLL